MGISEVTKISTDCSFGRKIVREESPLATSTETILDAIDDFSKNGGFGSSPVGKLELGFQKFPLGIGHVGEVGFSGERRHGISSVKKAVSLTD
jgi:hypothetical protein